jgi:predicted HTH domain antitoxin
MKTLTINLPEDFEKEKVLLSIAGQLYQQGALSAKQATDLAGVTMNELVYSMLSDDDPLKEYVRPRKKYKSTEEWIEALKEKQGYKGFNKERMEAFSDALDIQEPVELLLSQLIK